MVCQEVFLIFFLLDNAQNRNRTSDTRIFSPLLYQLSYLGEYVLYIITIFLEKQEEILFFFCCD